MEFKFISTSQLQALPKIVGVYTFRSEEGILLYIGKASNIKERVKNHFSQPTFKDNVFIPETKKIGFIITGSEIEALLLEAKLIKKYLPKYNTQWKDGKNYYFLAITTEAFPRVFITHQQPANKPLILIGPFVDGQALKQTLRVLRRVFPFRTCRALPKKACLYKELGLCLAPCDIKSQIVNIKSTSQISNIKNLMAVLQGKKNSVMKGLQREMRQASQQQNFEKAKTLRDQIRALENVFSHSRILRKDEQEGVELLPGRKEFNSFMELQKTLGLKNKIKRIEGYDISNIQGQQATGGLVVFENGRPNKNQYRKFHLKIEGQPNDTAMLREIISRRLKHTEWPRPQVMLIDGGIGQFNLALKLKTENEKLKNTKIISLAKRKNELFLENKKTPILLKNLPSEVANLILQIRDEAHRFAIFYHKKLRSKSLLA